MYIYSKWSGSGDLGLDKDELMNELERNLMSDGDLSYVLWKMQRQGMKSRLGRSLPSIQDYLERLRKRRQEKLEKYNLGSIMNEIRDKLDNILKTERQGIQKRIEEAGFKGADSTSPLNKETRENLRKVVEEMANRHLATLDKLPPDVPGKVKELANYDFMDEEAREKFQELMDSLKRNALQSHTRELTQKLQNMDAGAFSQVRRLTQAINEMLEKRLRGENPDFENFMRQFEQYFGSPPPQSLDELIERLESQITQSRSLLESMSAEDRNSLENLIRSMLDDDTQQEMMRLARNLERLHPGSLSRRQYPFSGDEPVSFTEALKIMEELQKMAKLESQLRDSQYNRTLDSVDKELIREVMGDEAAKEIEALNNITKVLEEAGYLHRKNDKFELTPRGMRKIGQKALRDVFAQLKKDQTGGHTMEKKGTGGERTDETKTYEFGDPPFINLQKTIMNALYRGERTLPLKLKPDDFEVYQTEELTRSATVLMLDLSLSMPMRGNFQAAKQVTIALDGLIRSMYPKDSLYIVGFSSYARQLKKNDLYYIRWDELDPYTNMQHGFSLARKLLAKERCPNKQIILISDGEPTAHMEHEGIYFQYPPSRRTLQATLKEVRNCTQRRIIINTFMLEGGSFLSAFVTQMARINKGRVFFTNADKLGQYILVDYITAKRKKIL